MKKTALVPEVIKDENNIKLSRSYEIQKRSPHINLDKIKNYSPNQNIKLTQNNIDNRSWSEKNVHIETNSTVNNINNNKKGFIYILFYIIALPFILIFKFFKFIFIKYDIVKNFNDMNEKNKYNKKIHTMFKKSEKIWKNEEVY